MSFKGITWAGNVYQKFETMCLEVEEAMYQDTVKYMENQVQKVGVSVKKFYSEVMDDMRPLSCIDPMNLASDDPSLIPYNDTTINKKPIQGILVNNRDLKKKENENQVNVTELFSPQSPGIFIENKSLEKSAASKKIGVQRRQIGIKRISKSNHPSKESCWNTSKESISASSRVASDNTCVTSSSDFEGRSEPKETVKGNAPNLDNTRMTPSSDFEGRSEPKETAKGNAPDFDNRNESPASDNLSKTACDDASVTSASSLVIRETGVSEQESTPPQDNLIESPSKPLQDNIIESPSEASTQIDDVSVNNLSNEVVRLKGNLESTTSSCSAPHAESSGVSSKDISSLRTTICNLEYVEKGVTSANEDTPMEDGIPSLDSYSCNGKSYNMSNKGSDSSDIELVENDEVCGPRFETLERSDGHDLEESCILVEGDDLRYPLQGTRKHKSYKKRIREALASKLRSRKDEQIVSSQHKQKLEMSEQVKVSVESDWELL